LWIFTDTVFAAPTGMFHIQFNIFATHYYLMGSLHYTYVCCTNVGTVCRIKHEVTKGDNNYCFSWSSPRVILRQEYCVQYIWTWSTMVIKLFLFTVNHRSANCGPWAACNLPAYIMRPAATFLNCVCTIKSTQQLVLFGIPIISLCTHVTLEPAHSNWCGPFAVKNK
jgi:hypothetical protein